MAAMIGDSPASRRRVMASRTTIAVVDHHADADRETAERHDVEGDALHEKRGERRENGERNRDRDDQRRCGTPQEREQDDHRKDRALPCVRLHFVDAAFDEGRLVREKVESCARRDGRGERRHGLRRALHAHAERGALGGGGRFARPTPVDERRAPRFAVKPFLYGLCDADEIRVGFLEDFDLDGFETFDARDDVAFLAGIDHATDVADAQRTPVLNTDREFGDFGGDRNSFRVRTRYSTSPSRRTPPATFTFSAWSR
jgi:hypothetical protein